MKDINLKSAVKLLLDAKAEEEKIKYYKEICLPSSGEKIKACDEKIRSVRQELESDKGYVRLKDEIKAAEGRATCRTVTPDDVLDALIGYGKILSIAKKAMEGISLRMNVNAQAFPNAYRFAPESTWFEAEFRAGSWRVIRVYRDVCGKAERTNVVLPDAAKAAIIEKYM